MVKKNVLKYLIMEYRGFLHVALFLLYVHLRLFLTLGTYRFRITIWPWLI